ncbi:MAG: phospholipase D-like domain-containing protein [Saprospiraceae bacterium]
MLPAWIQIPAFAENDSIELIPGGKPFFDALEAGIAAAREEIHFQTYIFNDDETGRRVLHMLREAADRGVQVYLVADGFGSSTLSPQTRREIRESNIHFRFFGRYLTANLRFGRRLHHKIVVFDHRTALIGGINVADKYNDINGQAAWLDFAVRFSGQAVEQAHTRCLEIWEKKKKTPWKTRFKKSRKRILARLRTNDWFLGRNEITSSLKSAFRHAEHSITLVAAYFIPTKGIMAALKKASSRGVKVRIMLGRVSDVRVARSATRYLYGWMLRNGIEIYEWPSTVLHAKVAVVDNYWTTIGSYNLNFLSVFESIEANLEIADEEFATKVKELISHKMLQECEQITSQEYQAKHPILLKASDWLAFYFLWAIARFFFFLDKNGPPIKGYQLEQIED